MGIVFRQSVKTSIVIFTGAFLGGFIIWLYTKYIPKQEFGFIRNLTVQSVFLSNFLLLGTGHLLIVYIHKFVNNSVKREVLLTLCFGVPIITTAFFTLLYFIFRDWVLAHYQPIDIPIMKQYFVWLPIYTLLCVYMTLFELYLGTQMKVAVSAFMREVVLRILNIILILLFSIGYIGFSSLVLGTILIYIVPIFIFLALALKTDAFTLSFNFKVFSKAEYKDMVHFSWFHFLFVISTTLLGALDIITLPLYNKDGLKSAAVYAVALYLVSFLQMPAKAMTTASSTIFTQAITGNDMVKAKDIFERASLNILIATMAMALVIGCNLNSAVAIIGTNYNAVITVFLILSIGRIVDLSTGMNDTVLSITNYYKFNVYLSFFIVVIMFSLVKILIPRYGIYGAAWSATITLIIFNVIKFVFVWKKLGMQPFSIKTLLTIIAALPALAVGYFFPYLFEPGRHIYVHTFMDAAMRSTLIVIVFMLMLYWLKPSPDLSEYIASIKKNKRLF